MARKRRGNNDDDDAGEQPLPEPSGAASARGPRRSSPRSSRARPGPQAREQKSGSFTKAVQQGRARRFTQEVVAEMRKVSWPNRPQLLQATMVVLVAVAIIAAFLGLADEISDWIVGRVF